MRSGGCQLVQCFQGYGHPPAAALHPRQLVRATAGTHGTCCPSFTPSMHHPTHACLIHSYNENVTGLRVRYIPALCSLLYEVLFWQAGCQYLDKLMWCIVAVNLSHVLFDTL